MNARAVSAVVAGIDLNGLGVVRSLARENIPVVAVDVDFRKPTARTRLARKHQVPALSGERFVEALLTLRTQFSDDPVLILTEEASVATVSAAREQVQRAYRIVLPEPEIVSALIDKTGFQELAEGHGFPVPRSVVLEGDGGCAHGLRYPCVLKPTTKNPLYSARFAKAYRVESLDETIALWRQMREVIASAILQEWIEGDDCDVYFCLQYRDRPDRSVASFVGRKIRQWPPLVGGTASCIPAPERAAEATDLTDRFFAAANFCGFGSMEFKRDRRDGSLYMVEPTVGRTDFQEEIATLNGINIPAIAYWQQLDVAPSKPEKIRAPVGWRDPVGEANALAALPKATGDLAGWAISWRDAYFRADDPGPYVARQFGRINGRLSKLVRRR
jgi:predicted ATP-grasp superfamily ATP-dependent carboligase